MLDNELVLLFLIALYLIKSLVSLGVAVYGRPATHYKPVQRDSAAAHGLLSGSSGAEQHDESDTQLTVLAAV